MNDEERRRSRLKSEAESIMKAMKHLESGKLKYVSEQLEDMRARLQEIRDDLAGGERTGMVRLPIVPHKGKQYYFDERLRQLRNVNNPHDYIDLNDSEVERFRRESQYSPTMLSRRR